MSGSIDEAFGLLGGGGSDSDSDTVEADERLVSDDTTSGGGGGGGGSVSLSDLLGFELGENARRLLRNPITFILVTIVSALLGLWEAALNWLAETYTALLGQLDAATIGALNAAAQPIVDLVLGGHEAIAAGIFAAAAQAGPFGIVVATAGWVAYAIVLAVIANAVIGLAATYLPIESIPVFRRVV